MTSTAVAAARRLATRMRSLRRLGSAVRAVQADFGDVLTAPGEADAAGLLPPRIGAEPAQLLGALATVARTLGTEDIMEPLD